MKRKNIKGQILAEVVIAIGLLAMILVGMSDLISRTTVSTRMGKQKDEASRVVEARLSYFRQEKDRDPVNFFTNIVHDVGGPFTSCGADPWPINAQYTFSCSERFGNPISGAYLVQVRASWTNKNLNDSDVTLSTIITRP